MKKTAYTILLAILLISCSKKVDSGSGSNQTGPSPTKSVLLFPAINSACTTGTVVSATQSTITFNWSASDNTDSYELNIKNLLTNTLLAQPSVTNQAQVTLLRNTPYSWYVISKSSKTTSTTQSDTWKFYNSGAGTVAYAPFPATITSPTYGQIISATNSMVNLAWTGSDVDNDILNFDVYLSTSVTPILLKSNVTDLFLNNVTVNSGGTYYWKVITRDTQGNTSDSGVYQFTVK